MPLKVKDIMIRDVRTVCIDDSVLRAAEMMNRYEIGSIVITKKRKPVGILTERDILKKVVFRRKDSAKTKVADVMSEPLVTVRPDAEIADAVQTMIKKKIKKLVVANRGHLKGVLSLTDLAPLLDSQMSLEKISLNGAPERMKKVFEIYYDPKRQIRKNCPFSMIGGMAISCSGPKCMWYVADKCLFLNLVEKTLS